MKGSPVSYLGEGVYLYDVVDDLKKHNTKTYPKRPTEVTRVYHHHSGRLGRSGFGGLASSANYSVSKLRWPGFAYHYWLPHKPIVLPDGSIVIYQGNDPCRRTYHTGGEANDHGIGVCWQGDWSKQYPSPAQYHSARMLCRYLMEQYKLDPIVPFSFHSESKQYGGTGKSTCPGPHIEQWVKDFRRLATYGT